MMQGFVPFLFKKQTAFGQGLAHVEQTRFADCERTQAVV